MIDCKAHSRNDPHYSVTLIKHQKLLLLRADFWLAQINSMALTDETRNLTPQIQTSGMHKRPASTEADNDEEGLNTN